MIRGEVAGVQVMGNSIRIQGVGSLTLSTEPLYVVDGNVVNSISDIQPYNVKSIEILKGSSASIYGSRGANGVILIKLIGSGDR
jgi:TonB-dependent SusC/RagA subfamily outer membrane receptor